MVILVAEGHAVARWGDALRTLTGGRILEIQVPPRWRERAEHVRGAELVQVVTHGKHLVLHFSSGWLIHTHAMQYGSWQVGAPSQELRKAARFVRLKLVTAEHEAIFYHGPVMEVLSQEEFARHERFHGLGPDLLHDDFEVASVYDALRREGAREIGDAVLDQRIVAGIGNIYKSEGLFLALIQPRRAATDVAEAELRLFFEETHSADAGRARDLRNDSHAARRAPVRDLALELGVPPPRTAVFRLRDASRDDQTGRISADNVLLSHVPGVRASEGEDRIHRGATRPLVMSDRPSQSEAHSAILERMIDRRVALAALLIASAAAGSCAYRQASLLNPADPKFAVAAPDSFDAELTTTRGTIVVRVRRDWSPHGAARFYTLVRNGFYTDVAFHRTIRNFVAQFGIHGDSAVSAAWNNKTIPDDTVRTQNVRGSLVFARGGPNSRGTQLYFNLVDNTRLDTANGFGFPPVGRIVEGLSVLDSLNSEYSGTRGGQPFPGPRQDSLRLQGNAYLRREFPRLDYILRARIVRSWE